MDVVKDGQQVWHEGKGQTGAGIEAEPTRQPATDGTEADGDNSVSGSCLDALSLLSSLKGTTATAPRRIGQCEGAYALLKGPTRCQNLSACSSRRGRCSVEQPIMSFCAA